MARVARTERHRSTVADALAEFGSLTPSDSAAIVGFLDRYDDTQLLLVRMLLKGLSRRAVGELLGLDDNLVRQHLVTLQVDAGSLPTLDAAAWDEMWASSREVALVGSFAEAWRTNAGAELDHVDLDEMANIGRQAAAHAIAAATWRRRVGETLDTQQVTELLGVTRQALDSRKRTGSVLALPGSGTSHYPTWQFDLEAAPPIVRPITLRIVTTFREFVNDISPLKIAGWASSPQPELDDRTPADWITAGREDGPIVLAAQRAAHLEAL